MRYLLLIALVVLAGAGCRVVPDVEQETPPPENGHGGLFILPDSLILEGDFDVAEQVLLSMLDDDEYLAFRNDILWRLTGMYSGRGMPDEGVQLLGQLEQSGHGDLTGWKVSLLDLSRRPVDALPMVPSDNVLLRMWLSRELEAPDLPAIVPAPVDMAERYVRVSLAPEGSLTEQQAALAVTDAILLPDLNERLLTELALRTRSGSTWVDELLAQISESEEKAALEAERMAYLQAGDRDYWTDMLDRGGQAAGIAARVLLRTAPGDFGESWRVADALLAAGDITAAVNLASVSSNSVFLSGLRMALEFHSGNNSTVISSCALVDSTAPDTLRARADLFRARALRASGSGSLAYAAYRDFAAEWPWHRTAREAAYLAGKYYDGEQEWARAADAYLVSLRSSGTWGGDERAHWRGGFSLYMSGQGFLGDSLWREAALKWPYGYWRDEMLFWRARYANRTGDHTSEVRLLEQVASEHPWEFYGMLAVQRLGVPFEVDLHPVSITLSDRRETGIALDMCSKGYGVLASEMLRYGESGDPGRRAIALGLLGEHGASISLLRSLDSRLREENTSTLPDSLLCWYFPSPYAVLSESVTDTMNLSASFVQGIMREESYFNRWVISSAGARGLIQLMPGTAYDVARWNGLPFLEEDQFFQPGNSVLYGALYINRQWRSYSGEPALFLAAYNAGPGNASRWVDMHGWDPQDPELFVEQITYRETRIYVKKVLRSSWIYERIRI